MDLVETETVDLMETETVDLVETETGSCGGRLSLWILWRLRLWI